LLENFLSDLAQIFSSAIVMAIEMLIRINQTLIEIVLPEFGYEY
jgi:hypothetical protein